MIPGGRNATGRAGIHVDRSPPPFAQGTVTKKGTAKDPAEFTLDGDVSLQWICYCLWFMGLV